MKIEKIAKVFINLHDKAEYFMHIVNLTQALNHGLILEIVHRKINFNQKSWLKPINSFQRDFFKMVNNAVFGINMENVRKHRNIKLLNIKRGRNSVLSEWNFHTTKFFIENLLAIEMRQTHILISKSLI